LREIEMEIDRERHKERERDTWILKNTDRERQGRKETLRQRYIFNGRKRDIKREI
jgi:hypothetical protein